MQTINIRAYTEDASQIEAIKAFLKALKIKNRITLDSPKSKTTSTKTDLNDDFTVPLEQQNAVLERIEYARQNPSQMLDWIFLKKD